MKTPEYQEVSIIKTRGWGDRTGDHTAVAVCRADGGATGGEVLRCWCAGGCGSADAGLIRAWEGKK